MRKHIFVAALTRAKSENGQVLIITALSLTVLLGFVAFATDVGLVLNKKRILQTAADSAAIAGAAQLGNAASNPGGGSTPCNTSNDNCWSYAAIADAVQNGVPSSSVTVNNPPSTGPHTSKNGYVEVIVTQSQPTVFMRLFGLSSLSATARAVATNEPSPSCVDTLSSTAPGVSLSGSADLTLTGCGLNDNATGGTAFTMWRGYDDRIVTSSTWSAVFQIPGEATFMKKTVPTTLTPDTGASTLADPLSSVYTAPPASDYSSGCTAQSYGTGTYTIGPSSSTGYVCYSSFTVSKGSPVITLNPGLYIITGSMSIASGGTLTGSGVTFYFVNSGSFSLSAGVAVNLTAPTTGNYAGLLFYQDPSDTNADSFVGGNSGTTNGIFYLPKANLTLANGSAAIFNADLVVGTLSMSGAATLKPYTPLYGGGLSTTALVE